MEDTAYISTSGSFWILYDSFENDQETDQDSPGCWKNIDQEAAALKPIIPRILFHDSNDKSNNNKENDSFEKSGASSTTSTPGDSQEESSTVVSICCSPNRSGSSLVTRSPTSVFKMEQCMTESPEPNESNKKTESPDRVNQNKSSLPHDPLKGVVESRKAMEQKLASPAASMDDDDDDDDDCSGPRNMFMPAIYSVRSPPSSPSASKSTRTSHHQQSYPDSKKDALSILLLDVRLKIFEIVAVEHVTKETTVGDVLSKARVQAMDSRLSQQTYLSLCNAVHELAAPISPVQSLLEDQENKKNDKDDPSLGRLLLAVPEGSTPAQVQQIQRALWSHPIMQRWWKEERRYRGTRNHRH
jgi:hypothetical protein